MFRIKPPRNQTTAKHVNLSPYPNNNIQLLKKEQNKVQLNRRVNGIQKKQSKPAIQKPKVVENIGRPLSKARIQQKTIYNPEKITKSPNFVVHKRVNLKQDNIQRNNANLKQDNAQESNEKQDSSKDNIKYNNVKKDVNSFRKPAQRMVLKRNQKQTKQHKLKLPDTNKIQLNNQPKLKKQSELKLPKKPSQLIYDQKRQPSHPIHDQKRQPSHPIHDQKYQLRIQQNTVKIESKPNQSGEPKVQTQKQSLIQNINTQNQNKSQKDDHQSPKKHKNPFQQSLIRQPQIQLQSEQKLQVSQQEQRDLQKQKETQQLMLRIQKRREARENQKRRIKQLEQKQKQNEERALQFIAQRNRNQRGIQDQQPNQQPNQGISGMIKFNDQLMHFSMAETIISLQIKKLLKTNFDDFPNASQIKYQIQQLQRINQSYEMIKYDQNNPLINGLKNYRVNIFNRIGQLILKAQSEGYSSPSFHIMDSDGRNNQNNFIPEGVRGLPVENHKDFIKYSVIQSEQECTICLNQIQIGQAGSVLQCGHTFHTPCINDWILSSANCPTCRFNIKFGKGK